MLIAEHELLCDKAVPARFFEWLWPERAALRGPRAWDAVIERHVRQFVVGDHSTRADLDETVECFARANVYHREPISIRVDAAKEGLFVAEFNGVPVNRLRGSTEAALPLAPSISTHVHRHHWGLHQLIWLYHGKLTDEQHALIAERLGRFNAASVVTKGHVDLRLPGFFSWDDPDRPHRVTSTPGQDCGTVAPRYPIDELDAQICAPLRREFVDDPYAA